VPATRIAIETASVLAEPVGARIHVIAARTVPPSWSLEQQSAPVHAFAKEVMRLTRHVGVGFDILPCVCRKPIDVTQLLPRTALVIVAGPSHRWWPTQEQRLAHDLSELGHRVLFVHTTDDGATRTERS
jgi:hypothetical protein